MLAAFSITPLGTADTTDTTGSVSGAVAEAVRIVRASGLPHETTSMFTTIEGEWDEVMAVVHECVERLLVEAPRVSVTMKLDIRPGVTGALASKVASVDARLDAADSPLDSEEGPADGLAADAG